MQREWPLLIEVLRGTQRLSGLNNADWDLLIRQAKRAQLLGSLAELASQQNVLNDLPQEIRRHLQSAQVVTAKQLRDLHWEIGRLKIAFQDLNCPLLLLKGAAYAIADLPPSRGRWFSDIDILVPFNYLAAVEKQLMLHGWISDPKSAYDQAYYRRWMHEIEPLTHATRGSVIDLHHNILPRTVSVCPDAEQLLLAAETLPNSDIQILSKRDRVIHSAVHLFYDGELEHGLRDLYDLKSLLNALDAQDKLDLVARAQQLGLHQAVYYALRYAALILNTPGLDAAMQKLEADGQVNRQIRLMDFLFLRALQPDHASCDDRWTGLARWLLYVRSHYLRMPLYLLIPHLLRKAWMRWQQPQS